MALHKNKKTKSRKRNESLGANLEAQTIGTHVNRAEGKPHRGKHIKSNRGGQTARHGKPRHTRPLENATISDQSGQSRRKGGNIEFLDIAPSIPDIAPSSPRKKRPVTLAEQLQGKAHKTHRLVILIIVVLILALAVGVGVYAYFKSANAKLDPRPSNVAEALVSAELDAPYYALCAAQIGTDKWPNDKREMAYMLVRVDEAARELIFVTIPANTQVRISNGDYIPLYQTSDYGGDAETVKALSSLLNVDISHFTYTTTEDLGSLVDSIGGISVNITEEVDDPNAGTKVIFAGDQELDGQQAKVLLRAKNFNGGFNTVAHNRVAFTLALVSKALSNTNIGITTLVGDVGDYISTDWDAAALLALSEVFNPIDTVKTYECVLAGYETEDMELKENVFIISSQTWQDMLNAINAGQDPNSIDASPVNVDPSSFTIEVRNGTHANGAATKLSERLTNQGYKIVAVGNAEDGVNYPETLVVYTDRKYEGAAKSVVDVLGAGRTVNGGDFYTSSANVIVIIGQDYTPLG